MREGQILGGSPSSMSCIQNPQARGYGDEYGLKQASAAQCASSPVRDKSTVEVALERLWQAIDMSEREAVELRVRLKPISLVNGEETKGSPPNEIQSCELEARLKTMANRVAEMAALLRQTRDVLCI